jgi:hypothetical protein
MRLWIALSALLLFSHIFMAQNQSGRSRVGDPPIVPHGTFHPIVDYVSPPRSLKELVKRADVVVDGVAQSVFPARLRTVGDPTSVERDTLFTVARVLKGKPETLRSLVITQMGGKYGDVVVVINSQWPLMPGDRHILFLNYDPRTIVPTYPRTDGNFSIINGDIGNFKIESDVVKWVSGLQVDALKKFESGTADDFIAQILVEVSAAK